MHVVNALHIAYTLLPTRDQDVIAIHKNLEGVEYAVSIVDGFNFSDKIHGNAIGREAAHFIADNFPKYFLATKGRTYKEKAHRAAKEFDKLFIEKYPRYVSAACAFLFQSAKETLVVAIGTIYTWIWQGNRWVKPEGIGNHLLPYPKYYSGSKTFLGLGEVKKGSFYSATPDVVTLSPTIPLFIATDGLDYVMNVDEVTKITRESTSTTAQGLLTVLEREIIFRNPHKDDISVLLRK